MGRGYGSLPFEDNRGCNQNVNKAADIRGIASFGQQQPFQFPFSIVHLPDNRKRRREAGRGGTSCLRFSAAGLRMGYGAAACV